MHPSPQDMLKAAQTLQTAFPDSRCSVFMQVYADATTTFAAFVGNSCRAGDTLDEAVSAIISTESDYRDREKEELTRRAAAIGCELVQRKEGSV